MRKARSAAVAAVFVALLFLPHAARGLPASDDTASDDTPPIVSYSIDGIAGTNDWFRGSTHGNNITLHWSVSDPESPIISTTGCDPAIQIPGPNTGTTRTCEATSDGGTTRITTRSLKIDADPPATTAAPSRPANSAGWYRAPLSVSWSGVDPTSGIASCHAPVSYNGPDTAGSNQTGSCTDNAGNSSSDTFTVRYDTVAPTTVATPSRAANGAGWYRAPLSIAWVGSDVTSGLAACSATLPYSGPDTGGTPEVGSCTDNAGNSSSDSFTVRYDTQAPNTVATPARPPNGAGWYRAPVAISWGGTDALSGVDSCSSAVTYSGPDTTGVTRSGSCTDRAGNSSSDSVVLHYDATAPATTAAPSPAPNANGWLRSPVTVSWSGVDPTSGIASCHAPVSYNGPDTAGSNQTGSCTDNAGNSSSDSFTVRYDTQAPNTVATPARPPNGAGWYRAPVAISWGGTDALSGVDSCSSAVTYSGPDTTGVTRSGSCTDRAGNSSSDSVLLHYDATAPTGTTASAARTADHDGWYNHSLRIDWSGSDATSGIASCMSRTYGGPDDANATSSGSCTDAAGNTSTAALGFQYDATGPAVTVNAARIPDHAGWYNRPVGISWSGTDATSGVDSCSAPITYSGPDSANASSVGGCTDHAGNSASPPPLAFRYDATAPVTSIAPGRVADANGWYNHALRISWAGSDPTSGINSCTSVLYSGPDAGSVARTGGCTDEAGNSSPPSTFRFHYDATAPGGLGVAPARPARPRRLVQPPARNPLVRVGRPGRDRLLHLADLRRAGRDRRPPDRRLCRPRRQPERDAALRAALRRGRALACGALAERARRRGRSAVAGNRSERTADHALHGLGQHQLARRLLRHRQRVHRPERRELRALPIHVHGGGSGREHGAADGVGDAASGAVRTAWRYPSSRACEAAVRLEAREESALLQLPALGGGPPGWQLVAGTPAAQAAGSVELQRRGATARARHVHVVRLAGSRAAEARPLRRAARQELLRGRLRK